MSICLIRPYACADLAACTAILAVAGRTTYGPVAGSAAFMAATQG